MTVVMVRACTKERRQGERPDGGTRDTCQHLGQYMLFVACPSGIAARNAPLGVQGSLRLGDALICRQRHSGGGGLQLLQQGHDTPEPLGTHEHTQTGYGVSRWPGRSARPTHRIAAGALRIHGLESSQGLGPARQGRDRYVGEVLGTHGRSARCLLMW